ncbi:hypothetical protein ACFV8T_26440 [Streptomyces sp. NPDC059832]|uniref:hypothetical protein n=1 Tax=unclassified Streptomyces TaxID=2593676 RepID=UPI00364B404A
MEAVVLALCALAAYGLFLKTRTVLHTWRLPAPSISMDRLDVYQKQAFQEIWRQDITPAPRRPRPSDPATRGNPLRDLTGDTR